MTDNIILYPVTEIHIGVDKYKLCLTKDDNSYLLRLCYNDFKDFNMYFTCKYEILTEFSLTHEILMTGVERYAKEKGISNYIPLVVKRDIYTCIGVIVNLDTYEILLLSTDKECGVIQKVTSNIRGIIYENESEYSKRNSSIQI